MKDELELNWKRGFRSANVCSVQDAFEELEIIREKNGGEIQKAAVVKAARSKKSKLHGFFEWSDTEAAKEYRLWQAGRIIASIEVIRPEAPEKGHTRQYEISRSYSRPKANSYQSIDDIMADPIAKAELLNRAFSELLAVRRRYHMMQELAIVFRALAEAIESHKV